MRGTCLSFMGIDPVGDYTTHGQCDAKPTVIFPATERHPLCDSMLLGGGHEGANSCC